MTQAYECEVRIFIRNISEFEKRLSRIGKIDFEYNFTDYYYINPDHEWNPVEKNLRIRQWIYPKRGTHIYFVKNKVIDDFMKQSQFSEGKLNLYSGKLSDCKNLLDELGFVPWFTVKKEKAKIWSVKDFKLAVEYIEQVGWTAELEFEGNITREAKEKIDNALAILDISKKEVTFKTVSQLVSETRQQDHTP